MNRIEPPRLVLIAAVARNGVIGRDNALPWHLPGDMAHFRERTRGRPVLMGRRTWESLPPRFRPLPGRRNLVLTRQAGWQADGAEPVPSIDAAIERCAGAPELMVIGGAEVYARALSRVDELVLTEVDADVEGDARLPADLTEGYACIERHRAEDPAATHPYGFSVWRRRPA